MGPTGATVWSCRVASLRRQSSQHHAVWLFRSARRGQRSTRGSGAHLAAAEGGENKGGQRGRAERSKGEGEGAVYHRIKDESINEGMKRVQYYTDFI